MTRLWQTIVICMALALGAFAQQAAPETQPSSTPQAPSATPNAPSATPNAPSATPNAPSATLATAKTAKPEREGGIENNFHDFLHQLASPLTPIAPAVTAGIGMYTSKDAAYGSGAHGYFNRYAVAFGDQFNSKFLRYFLMPTMFNQVERYKPMDREGDAEHRIAHAFAHSFVTRTRNGHNTLNMSGVPASLAVGAIGTAYYPDQYTTKWNALQRAGYQQIGYFAGDLWTEFKPDICRGLHLPCGKRK